MKKTVKIIAYMMAFAIVFSAFGGIVPVKASAEETPAGIVLPEFEFPMKPYKTFAETGIPLDEIRAAFDNAAEYVFVDGKLRVKSMGEKEFSFRDADYNDVDFEFIDGYYYVDITEEELERGFYSNHEGPDDAWEFGYEETFDLRFIRLYHRTEFYNNSITIYPDEGWGDDYVTVYYDGANDSSGYDAYVNGGLSSHEAEWDVDDDRISITYTAKGEVNRVFLDIDNVYYYYYPNDGWSDDLPKYEDYEISDFVEMIPSMLGCDHKLAEPGCEDLGHCTVCGIITADPLGHTWTDKGEIFECTVCGIQKYAPIELPKISFENIKPKAKLSNVALPFNEIRQALKRDLDMKYEDGVLKITHFEGASVDAFLNGEFLNGEFGEVNCSFEIEENELDDIEIRVHSDIENNSLMIYYDKDGKARGYNLTFYGEDTGEEIEYLGYVEENFDHGFTRLYYTAKAENGAEYSFADSYLNGKFCEREITYYFNDTNDSELEVRYNSKGEIIYIEAETEDDVYYNFEHKTWSYGRNYLSPADAPAFAEGKTIDELIKLCPSGLDFIKAPTKESNIGTVVAVVIGSIFALGIGFFVGYEIGKKKKA